MSQQYDNIKHQTTAMTVTICVQL